MSDKPVARGTALDDVSAAGAFVRRPTSYHDFISKEPGAKYPPESGRYLLVISYACPWACRCLTVRNAKGLQDHIPIAVVGAVFRPTKPEEDDHRGWVFDQWDSLSTVEPLFGCKSVRELYEKTLPPGGDMPARYTVPVLVDTVTKRVVNNESSEIIRMFNSEFNHLAKNPGLDLYPEELRSKIDEINSFTYPKINDGVYRCGFATSQKAYEDAVTQLFDALDQMEKLLATQRYLVGDRLTEADVRLVQTLIRFDPVYVVHFKCSKKCIREYQHLPGYMRDVVQSLDMLGGGAIRMNHITHHYFESHESINPKRIVAIVPDQDLSAAHGRDKMMTAESPARRGRE